MATVLLLADCEEQFASSILLISFPLPKVVLQVSQPTPCSHNRSPLLFLNFRHSGIYSSSGNRRSPAYRTCPPGVFSPQCSHLSDELLTSVPDLSRDSFTVPFDLGVALWIPLVLFGIFPFSKSSKRNLFILSLRLLFPGWPGSPVSVRTCFFFFLVLRFKFLAVAVPEELSDWTNPTAFCSHSD